MASILKWAKKTANDIENRAQAVAAQVNPLDDNRTYNTVRQNGAAYAPSAPQSIGNQLVRNAAVQPVTRSINTLNAARINMAGLGRAGFESAFGTDRSYQNALNDTVAASNYAADFGLGGKGAYLTSKQAASTGGGGKGLKDNFIKPFTVATAEVAPFAVPGAGAVLAKGAGLGARVATEGALNTVVGGASNAAMQVVNTGKIDAKELAKAAVISGAAGAVLPVAGAGLKKGAVTSAEKVAGKPFRNVSDKEIQALQSIGMKRSGYGESVANPTSADFSAQSAVQKRLRLNPNDTASLDDIVNSRRTFDSKLQNAGGLPQLIDQRFNTKGLAVGGSTKPIRTADGATTKPTRQSPPTEPVQPTPRLVSSKVDSSLAQSTSRSLNTERLNVDAESKQILNRETQDTIDRLSNEDVQTAAKGAGLDTRTHTPEQTRQIIAKQLNVRQDAVSYLEQSKATTNIDEKAQLIKMAAERGRTSREQGTDIARQLQARKIIANKLDTPEQRIFKLLDNAGINPDVYSKRLATVDFKNTKEVVKAYREMVPATASNWLDTVRYNSMLSSPLTQAVNIFGNAQNVAIVAPVEKTLRGALDAAGGLFGKERQYAAGEGAAYFGNSVMALRQASTNFVDALRGTGKYANPDFEDFNIPLAQGGIKGAAFQTLSAPMRVLDGMDKFFRTLADAGEEGALKARENAGIAIKGNREALKEAEQSYRVFQTEIGEPGQGMLNQGFDEFAKLVMSARNNKSPFVSLPAKFTVPFVKTVNNINKQGIVDYSPLGFVNLKGNADKTTAVTRAIMGSAIFGGSAALIAEGKMTWAEPRNADERARFRAEGKQPYAIKFGDKWVNFSKLTPSVAFPMAMTAALHDAFESGKTDDKTIDKVLQAFAKSANFFSDQSYAKSVGDTLGAVGGDTEAVAQAAGNYTQQVVPFRALTGWVARISDPTERKVDTTQGYFDQQVQSLMQQYPGLRQKTPTRDYKGTPIAANNQVLNGFSPVKITKDRGIDSVDLARDEVKKLDANKPALSKSDAAELTKIKQKAQSAGIKNFISSDDYAVMTPEERAKAVKSLDSKVGREITANYKASKGMSTTTSSSTTTINSKISDHSKKVLTEYDSLDADTRKKKAATENSYDYKVAQAKYDNKIANNDYSTTQRITAEQSLAKAKAGIAYSKEIRDLYQLSNKNLYAYVSTNPDGKNIANQVLAYGDALVTAGVETKNNFKSKYGKVTLGNSSTGKRSGGRRGRKSPVGKAVTIGKTPRINTKAKSYNVAKLATPTFKSSRQSIPKYVAKTPKLNVKKARNYA